MTDHLDQATHGSIRTATPDHLDQATHDSIRTATPRYQ